MEALVNRGMDPFTFNNAEMLAYPNEAGMDLFYRYRELIEEMAGYHDGVLLLQRITWRMRGKFNNKEHLEGLNTAQRRKFFGIVTKARQYDNDMRTIRLWTNLDSITKPNEMIYHLNGQVSASEVLEYARDQAQEIGHRLRA